MKKQEYIDAIVMAQPDADVKALNKLKLVELADMFDKMSTKTETDEKQDTAPIAKEPSLKDKCFEYFKANPSLKSTQLLDHVVNTFNCTRKVASSYLCYYRQDNGIQAIRGLSREDKLKKSIFDVYGIEVQDDKLTTIINLIKAK